MRPLAFNGKVICSFVVMFFPIHESVILVLYVATPSLMKQVSKS